MAIKSDGSSPPHGLATQDTERGGSAPAPVAGLWLALIAAPATFGVTSPAIVLPKIADGYGLTLDVASWLVTVTALAIAVGTPLAGGLISRRGLRAALITSTLLLIAGTVVVAAMPWLSTALAGRALQALGSTGLIAVAMNLAGTARRMGLITSTIAACAAVGPLVGSLVTNWTSWLVVLLLPVVAALFVPPVLRHASTTPADESPFDARGAVLLTALATALVVIPYFPLPAAICAAVAALLLALHIRARPDGFVPVALLRSPLFIGVSLLALLLATSFFRLLFVIPGKLSDDAGWTEDAIGVGTLVAQVAGSVPAFVIAAVAIRMGRIPVAIVLTATGILAAVMTAVSASAIVVLAALAIALFAAAGGQGALMAYATAAVDSTKRPVAIGLFNLSYQLGGALGPAIVAMSVAS
ncbi:MFS transporter [Streptomyces bacillaris]|uniref:Tetracycline resistance protein n=3 Tax=Streptomyces TaxID=1883 RepID=A0AAD0Q7B5_9ACTN|nr:MULTISPECIES: MFS transporter [Streptomyces]NUW23028.1 MFS transporter [Streptomyces roseoviolaceus]ATY97377.1 MFS transporter [Streptomyces cavourensis]AXI73209.1 MFS transporter [Streptomyces cavourensis]MBH0243366.1 MFS transporter [Streptomyces cavourensis]NUV39668.1 MFS transporter [Streptomyces sp. CAI-24]